MAEGGWNRRVVDRDHHGSSCGDSVHGSAARDRPRRKASVAARRHDRHGLWDRARLFGGRNPASAGSGVPRLRGHRLYVDADRAAHRRLCVERRSAVRPELWAAAAVGLGGVRGGSVGLRAIGRFHCHTAPDLGHRHDGSGGGSRQPWTSASGRSQTAPAELRGGSTLLRDPGFLAIILAAALVQASHAAYYVFASITWQLSGLGGLTIAGLWVLGVLAEIVVFALSPRFTRSPAVLVVIGAVSAVARWVITAQEPPVAILAVVQLMHGLTFGLTQIGTMMLLARHVPIHVMARGQGYLAACSGIVASSASILSGAIYARYGQGVYYVMAAMALSGAIVMWLARHRLADQPHNAASGG